MPGDPKDEYYGAEEKHQEMLHMRQRRAINNAYAALEGRSYANTFAAFTFEEAADAHLEVIGPGTGTQAHPCKIDRVKAIQGELNQAVEELKKVPPEAFLDVNLTQTANTPDADDDFWGEDSSIA